MIKFVAEDAFVHTGKLISLKMGDNFILAIPSSVDSLNSLQVLDMNTNSVTEIRNFEFLSYMPNIKILNFATLIVSRQLSISRIRAHLGTLMQTHVVEQLDIQESRW